MILYKVLLTNFLLIGTVLAAELPEVHKPSPLHMRSRGLAGRATSPANRVKTPEPKLDMESQISPIMVATIVPESKQEEAELQEVIVNTSEQPLSLVNILKGVEDDHIESFRNDVVPSIIQEATSIADVAERDRKIQRKILKAQRKLSKNIGEEQKKIIRNLSFRNSLSKDEESTWIARIEVSMIRSQANINHKLQNYQKRAHAPRIENAAYAQKVEVLSKQHQDVIPIGEGEQNEAPFIVELDHISGSDEKDPSLTFKQVLARYASEHKKVIGAVVGSSCSLLTASIVYLIYRSSYDK